MRNRKIINIRTRIGLTQTQLAKQLNVTQGAISHWERGISYPSIDAANKIVKIAGKRGVFCKAASLRIK